MHADGETPPARLRAGGTVLNLLAGPLCVSILRAHLDGPLRLPDLRERIGGAAQTTLRGQVGNLRDIGALERNVRPGMPYTVENELSECGHEILAVADVVEAWLSRAPLGPIALGSEAAKGAIRALVGGWSSNALDALAVQPLSLTELSFAIEGLSYPALERRLAAMRAVRQIEVQANDPGKAKPYLVTDWARCAVAPLATAARCECRHLSELAEPATEADVETAFLLAVPLARLPADRSGACQLAVDPLESDEGEGAPTTGVSIEVADGRVTSCSPGVGTAQGAEIAGSIGAWTSAVAEGSLDDLRAGDDDGLAWPLVEGVYSALRPA